MFDMSHEQGLDIFLLLNRWVFIGSGWVGTGLRARVDQEMENRLYREAGFLLGTMCEHATTQSSNCEEQIKI